MKRGSLSARQALLWIVSLLVAASMICSFITYLQPPRSAPTPVPTSQEITFEQTATPAPTTEPQPTAQPAAPPGDN